MFIDMLSLDIKELYHKKNISQGYFIDSVCNSIYQLPHLFSTSLPRKKLVSEPVYTSFNKRFTELSLHYKSSAQWQKPKH